MQNLLTIREVATRLNMHYNTVYHYIKKGKLQATRPGGGYQYRITEEALERFIQGNGIAHGGASNENCPATGR